VFRPNPDTEAGSDGTLLLTRGRQVGIGRTPWSRTRTIRHLTGAAGAGVIVAGQGYVAHDRAVGDDFFCDVDLANGAWVALADRVDPESGATTSDIASSGEIARVVAPLADRSSGHVLPAPCESAFTAWFDTAR